MPTVSTFSNGQVLTSSALTQDDLNKLLQTLALSILGIDPATDPKAYSKVRVAWKGVPAWRITDDICSIKTTEKESEYNLIRDRKIAADTSAAVTVIDTYQRDWQAVFVLYGPTSFDHARLIKSALLSDGMHDTLAASTLYLIPELTATKRAPEFFQGQWWDRSDTTATFSEGVTESLVVDSIASAELLLYSERGLAADLTIS